MSDDTFGVDMASWPFILDAIPRPLNRETIDADLAWLNRMEQLGRQKRPGRLKLQRRWGVSSWVVKCALSGKPNHASHMEEFSRKREMEKRQALGRVYLIGRSDGHGPVKLGFSVNPEARLASIQTGHPHELQLLSDFPGTEYDERELHDQLSDHRERGEWFSRCDAVMDAFRAKAERS